MAPIALLALIGALHPNISQEGLMWVEEDILIDEFTIVLIGAMIEPHAHVDSGLRTPPRILPSHL